MNDIHLIAEVNPLEGFSTTEESMHPLPPEMNHELVRARIADFDRQARRDAIAVSARQGRAPTRPQHTILNRTAGRLRQHILALMVTRRGAEDRT